MYLKRLPRSQLSRREREFRSFSLMLRDENKNFFLLISCFETRTRKQKMKVILTGIPGIENSRPALKLTKPLDELHSQGCQFSRCFRDNWSRRNFQPVPMLQCKFSADANALQCKYKMHCNVNIKCMD